MKYAVVDQPIRVIRFDSLAIRVGHTVPSEALTATHGRPSKTVDRLTTGRRHVRAGSVSVTELITKQAAGPELPAPARSGQSVMTDLPVVARVVPTSHRRHSARGAQLAKITSLGVATIVLCGAAVAASSIAHQRQHESATTERPVEQISDEQALLPDELNRRLSRDGAKAATSPSPAPDTKPPLPAAAPAPPPRASTTTATTAATDPPVAVAPVSDLDLVRKFYDFLPSDPAVAFDLVSPGLLHSTLGRFLESWSQVRSVDVAALKKQVDGVHAVVRMRLADGGNLRLQQLLTVGGSPRRIIDVELLSARRN